MMKRLSILAMTALMALFLTACGENIEKKVETSADAEMNAAAPAAEAAQPEAAAPAAEAAPATEAPAAEPAKAE